MADSVKSALQQPPLRLPGQPFTGFRAEQAEDAAETQQGGTPFGNRPVQRGAVGGQQAIQGTHPLEEMTDRLGGVEIVIHRLAETTVKFLQAGHGVGQLIGNIARRPPTST